MRRWTVTQVGWCGQQCFVGCRLESSTAISSNSFGIGPRIIFFGGDHVSVIALEAIHRNLQLFSHLHCCDYALHVVCPTLLVKGSSGGGFHSSKEIIHSVTAPQQSPPSHSVSPSLLECKSMLKRHKHHFPVARYCAEHNISCSPVDHVSSIVKSSLLEHSSPRGCADAKRYYDISVVVSFRYFLPGKLLDQLPPTINLHPSLLPRYRGASPIYTTMLRGEPTGGYSIIKIRKNETMDCGDILRQESIPIPLDSDIRTYFPNVAGAGASGLCSILFGSDLRQREGHLVAPLDGAPMVAGQLFSTREEWLSNFESSWNAATAQTDKPTELKKDPYHAPLLDRRRAALCFHTQGSIDVHNTWRAFAGGKHHRIHPTAILDKGATPCASQQLDREEKKLHRSAEGSPSESSSDAVLTSASSLSARDRLRVTFVVAEAVHHSFVSKAVGCELLEVETRYAATIQKSIPSGAAYFPVGDSSICAVKCREGWFFWRAGILQNSTQQPALRLRQGLAMKCGVVYEGLFCKHPHEV
jgi:methionyl-tRNA formyltransferase